MLQLPYLLPGPFGYSIAAVLGTISHRFYFIHGEHHLLTSLYVILFPFISTLLFVGNYYNHSDLGFRDALTAVLSLDGIFLASLYSSMVFYRVFEHPLRDFPGPGLAAVSKLWHVFHILNISNHVLLDGLFRKYGTIVRTGPQELTIYDPAAWQIINDPRSGCIKSSSYDQMWPITPLNAIRSKAKYIPRRRLWDEAMKSLTGKETRIHHHANVLAGHIRASRGKPVDMNTWLHNVTFDIMGDLGFGKSFGFTTEDDDDDNINKHHLPIALMEQALRGITIMSQIPWIMGLFLPFSLILPFIAKRWVKSITWVTELCDEQMKTTTGEDEEEEDKRVLFSRFIRAADGKKIGLLEKFNLYGDTFSVTAAASDTTFGILTMLFYELAANEDIQRKLREEIAGSTLTDKDKDAGYLDACINETMRLYPAVPTGGVRQTVDDKGFYLKGKWIPPNTILVTPRWTIMRLESAFEKPNEFIPERWTSRPEMIKDIKAFNSFSSGRHSCAGKQLAMAEMRILVSVVVSQFSFSLSPSLVNKTSAVDDWADNFTAIPGKLELVFHPLSA
ncbi:cytochrome P450 [Poronia punctata]|nr:cytochrome P450 [Poronia punctata]